MLRSVSAYKKLKGIIITKSEVLEKISILGNHLNYSS